MKDNKTKKQFPSNRMMNNPNDVIREIKEIATNSEHRFNFIAEYIISKSDIVANLTIKELAQKTYSSPATINRFVTSLQLDGYKEFIYLLRYYNRTDIQTQNIIHEKNTEKTIEEYFLNTSKCLKSTKEKILLQQLTIKKVVKHLENAKRILLFAVGGTNSIAEDFGNKMLRLGFQVTTSRDAHNGFYIAKNSREDDFAIFLSYSGETTDLIKLAAHCKENQTPFLSITKDCNNRLRQLATYQLEVISDEPIKRSYSTTSRIVMLAVLDIIYLNLLSFKPKQYQDVLDETTLEKI